MYFGKSDNLHYTVEPVYNLFATKIKLESIFVVDLKHSKSSVERGEIKSLTLGQLILNLIIHVYTTNFSYNLSKIPIK